MMSPLSLGLIRTLSLGPVSWPCSSPLEVPSGVRMCLLSVAHPGIMAGVWGMSRQWKLRPQGFLFLLGSPWLEGLVFIAGRWEAGEGRKETVTVVCQAPCWLYAHTVI